MNTLLLLEDDFSLVDGLVYSLKKNDYSVEVARTVQEALALLPELDRFDIANYKFVLRRLAKGNRFARFFYGGDDVPVADLSEGNYIKKTRTPWKLPKHCFEKSAPPAAEEKK